MIATGILLVFLTRIVLEIYSRIATMIPTGILKYILIESAPETPYRIAPGIFPSISTWIPLSSGLLRISTETPTSIAPRIPTGIPPVIILRFLSRLLQ